MTIFRNIILYLTIILAQISAANEEFFKETYSYDIVYGKNDAPVQVLEYYSLTCPHCSHFYTHSFPKLKQDYIDTGKVKWIKRSYTIDKQSLKGTMLLECVDKDKRENYLKILLNKQSNWAYQKDFITILENIASLGGMKKETFKECMENKELELKITNASQQAREALKITGTPSFFINKEYKKVYSENSFREALDSALKTIK